MQEVRRHHRTSLGALVNSQSTKNLLASVIGILVGVLDNAQSVLKSAANQIGELKSDHIQSQNSVIALQDELIKSKTEQIAAVQSSVKTEMKSFADIVKKGSQNAVTKQTIQRAVKTAVIDSERSKNVVSCGVCTEADNRKKPWQCFQGMVGPGTHMRK